MNSKSIAIGVFAIMSVLACLASAKASGNIGGRDIGASLKIVAVPSVAQGVVSEPGAVKDWTIMFYLNGENNLGPQFAVAVDSMEQVGSTANMNVVVELGLQQQGAKRMFIRKKTGAVSSSVVVSSNPAADMGNYKDAIDFMKWAKSSYPAKHYMFVIGNHGGGWRDLVWTGLPANNASTKGISYSSANDYIHTQQLGEIFRQAGPVDVFFMHACSMQMAEVDYEVKDYVGVIVASEEALYMGGGISYIDLLDYIAAHPDAPAASIGRVLEKSEQTGMAQYDANIPATLSTINAAALRGLPAKLNAFADAVMNANDTTAAAYAVKNVLRFNSPTTDEDAEKMESTYVDLYDFVKLLSQQSGNTGVNIAAQNLMNYITGELILSSISEHVDTQGVDYRRCKGIAINMTLKDHNPTNQLGTLTFRDGTKYADIALSKASHWADFVAWTDKVWAGQQ